MKKETNYKHSTVLLSDQVWLKTANFISKFLLTGLMILFFFSIDTDVIYAQQNNLAASKKVSGNTKPDKKQSTNTGLIGRLKSKFDNDMEEEDEDDHPGAAALFEFNRTKDPATGTVPSGRLITALDQTIQLQGNVQNKGGGAPTTNLLPLLSWSERGPYTDAVGPSNGNSRANGGITGGRVRAIWVDLGDATKKTVWVGGVDGGLWKSTDITVSPANWQLINDYLSNLAISGICQDPTNVNTMYFCTGESYYNADAVAGVGVFKSTDHGVTWNLLASTNTFTRCTRILCDASGNVYLATRSNGLRRSTDGGATWTNITPSTAPNSDICDMELSSTGRLHIVTGIFSTQAYRYTDIPATATSASGWNSPSTAFPSYTMRAEIACLGNTLYAAPANSSYQVPTIYKSNNGGVTWAATASQPSTGTWANGQGWYSLSVRINPADSNQVIVGGLDNYKSSDGGNTWTKISAWVGTTGQYVHADQHELAWWDNGTKMLFGCDGGVHFSSDGGITIRDRNIGLRVKQFYSVAIHPTTTNYFLAGAQDNGTHQLSQSGLSSSIEVTGGDGAFVAIDQDQPQYQFGAYVYNQYRRSTNGGTSWSSVNFSSSVGQFINPFEYDNTANIIYCSYSAGNYLRWTDPQTGSTSAAVTITALNSSAVTALAVSPYTANRLYLGTAYGRVVKVDNANTIASGSAGSNLSTGLPTSVNASCIAVGTSDQNLMVCYSNYGVQNIWVSTNGGTSWTGCDGNLPDMPVRWCMFYPGDDTKAYIATETGVWETSLINGASTVWSSNPTFPTVRTDMIRYRASDRTIAAGTHGRGVWTATVPVTCDAPVVNTPTVTQPTCAVTTGTIIVNATNANTMEYSINNGLSWQLSSTFSGLAGGSYNIVVRLQASPTCSTAYSGNPLVINSIVVPTPTISGTTSFCQGSQSVLSTGTFSSYLWSTGATSSSITVNAAGTFTVTVTNSSGCTGTASVTTSVLPVPTCSISGSTSICPGTIGQLCAAAGTGNLYLWSYGNSTQCISITGAGTYTVTVTNSNGCSTSCSVTVSANTTPVCTISGNTTVCQGSPANLCAPAGNSSYLWSTGASSQCISTTASGTYTVTVTAASGCTNSCGVNVSINTPPTCNISGNLNICDGASTSLCASAGAATYVWSTGDTSQCIAATAAGTYTVSITDANGCTNSCNATVSVSTLPLCNISGSTAVCAGSTTTLCAASGAVSYLWSTGETTQCINSGSILTYMVTVTNATGCSSTCSADITINPLPNVSFTGLASTYTVTSTSATLTGTPPGGIFSGPGISGNIFDPAIAGAGGPYTITYSYTDINGCSNTQSQQTSVTNCTTPAKPGIISASGGNAKVCPGESRIYTISPVSGATSYLWTPPTGGVVTAGQGSVSATITYNSNFVANDSAKVAAVNSCGTGIYRALKVTRGSNPAQPGIITGLATGVCGMTGVPYSVTNVSGVTFNWSNSNTNFAAATGQGTSSITANFSSAYLTGTLSVTASNGCGTSTPRNLTVKAVPPTASSITGPATVCANQFGVPYSTASLSSALTYTWVAPTGSHVSDGITTSSGATLVTTATSVTVNFGGTAGNVKVRGNNSCGSGAYLLKAITFNCRQATSDNSLYMQIYPNPATSSATLQFDCIKDDHAHLSIYNAVGQLVITDELDAVEGTNEVVLDLSSLSKGVYNVQLKVNGSTHNVKLGLE